MPAKKLALFVDVESLQHQLRTQHHRTLDPQLLLETAAARGSVEAYIAVADWRALPESVQASFAEQEGIERVQVERRLRSREGGGGRRREVVRDLVDLELLAQVIELLFRDQGPEVDELVVATGDSVAARIVRLVRERFAKPVHVIGVEGAVDEELQEWASSWEELPMPALEPTDLEGLEKLVPLLESLEKRKRYLNFKYIRETVVRRLDRPDRSFDGAERLLSEAIACGLLLKRKVEDKYNPGQLFTAYALDRDHELFGRFGSGEPAPDHDELEREQGEAAAADTPDVPTFASRNGRERPQQDRGKEDRSADRQQDDARGKRKRRRRRRRSGSNGAEPAEAAAAGNGAPAPEPSLPAPTALSAGAAGGGGRRKKRGSKNHRQDRTGRSYEAPSRFLQDPNEGGPPPVADDDIDEEQILRALRDLG